MSKIERFEDIEAWKLAREANKLIHNLSSAEKFAKDFALCNQIRRASISILSNIAEGFERSGNKEFLQFLAIAKGSCGEVRAQIYVALDLNYISRTICSYFKQIIRNQPNNIRLYEIPSTVGFTR